MVQNVSERLGEVILKRWSRLPELWTFPGVAQILCRTKTESIIQRAISSVDINTIRF